MALVVLALLWGVAGFCAPLRGIVLIWDSADPAKVALHRELSDLMVRRRAAGDFAGLGLVQEFSVYDFGQRPHAQALAILGASRPTAPAVALAELDAHHVPRKLLWKYTYSSAADASAVLDEKLGIEPPPPPEETPSPSPSPSETWSPPPSPSPSPCPSPTETPKPRPSDRMHDGESLNPGGGLVSPDGHWKFVCQYDGNCVIYHIQGDAIVPIWNTATRAAKCTFTLSTDGKLRVLNSRAETQWQSEPGPEPGHYELRMQNNGNLVLWRQRFGETEWEPFWESGTGR